MAMLKYLGILLLTSLVQGQWEISAPQMSLLEGGGLRMAIPDEVGHTLFAVHYSINVVLTGVEAGQYNFDVNTPTGGEWVHENTNMEPPLVVGDVVYYWIMVYHEGGGYQLTDQSWNVVATTTATLPSTPTTPPLTTTVNGPTTTHDGSDSGGGDGGDGNGGDGGDGGDSGGTGDGGSVESCSEFPCMIFEDNFDTLDHTMWEHEKTLAGGGNWEFQAYINNRTNSYVKDGVLYLKPTLTADSFGEGFLSSGVWDIWGGGPASMCTGNYFYGCSRTGTPDNYLNPILSARLRTVNKFDFRYGKVEVEAQMPRGDWIWPAIWLLPSYEEYGGWPSSGEIDIIESRGNDELHDEHGHHLGNRHMGSTLHWGPFFQANRYYMTSASAEGNFADAFHKYAVEWHSNGMTFYVDDNELLTVTPPDGGFWEMGNFENDFPGIENPWIREDKMAPFNRKFHIIMNVAVGGTNGFFSDSWCPTKPWNNQSPTSFKDFWLAKDDWYPSWRGDVDNGEGAAMKVNYVRVWKMSADDM